MKRKPVKARKKMRRAIVRKVIETPSLMAVLEVPAVFYADDPKKPYLEPATLKLLTQARRFAASGNTEWLKKHGAKIYVNSPAA